MNMSKTMTVFVASVFSLTAAGAAIAQTDQKQAGVQSDKGKVQMASRDHGRGHGGKGMRGHRRGAGGFTQLLETFDANNDGDLTQDEVTNTRKAQLTKFDADNDGALDLAEYQELWLDAMRERMVDRFQSHDDDGDGSVTIEEYNERFVTLVERRDRNDDGVLNAEDIKRPSKGPSRRGHN